MHASSVVAGHPPGDGYADRSSLEVLRPIGEQGDSLALREFHNHRRLFVYNGSRKLLFMEYSECVCRGPTARRLLGENTLLQEEAQNQLVDRFCNLRPTTARRSGRSRCGPDCRKNFAAIVRAVDEWHAKHRSAGALELEATTARIAQERIAVHALFACRDALRTRNPTRSRFQAGTPYGPVTVCMPRWLTGRRRREWIDQNTAAPENEATYTSDDLQDLADARYGHSRITSLDDSEALGTEPVSSSLDWLVEHEITTRGIAAFIADEKAIRVSKMRPSIAALGPDGVRRLVLRLFEAIENGLYDNRAIAIEFGLSPASLSRFFPRRWQPDDHRPIPPFYANLCQALAAYAPFTEIARKAGVWKTVRRLLNERRGDGHES
jgi:hypothetical protein